MSVLAAANAAAGGAPYDSTPEEKFKPFDEQSVAWLTNPMKVNPRKGRFGELDHDEQDRKKKYFKLGLSETNPVVSVASPYDLCDAKCGENMQHANGVEVIMPDPRAPELAVAFVPYKQWNMPLGKAKLGPAASVPCLVTGAVVAVDLFLKVDGKEFTDGHVIVGNDGDIGKDQKAIDRYMTQETRGSEQEQWCDEITYYPGSTARTSRWARQEMNSAIPDKPWGTIYGHRFWYASERAILLPLIVSDIANVLKLTETRHYGVPLAARFAEVLNKVGKGKHNFELRIRPRQTIDIQGDDADEMSMYFIGGDLEGKDNDGMHSKVMNDPNTREQMTSFLKDFGSHALSADAPFMTAKWSMDVDPKAAANGISRKAFPVSEDFDDPVGAIEAAWPIRHAGPAYNEAKKRLGSGVQCVHLIPTDSNSYNGRRDMGLMNSSDPNINEVCFFWACFKAGKGDGLLIRCTIQRPKLRNGYPTSGEWKFWGNDYEKDRADEVVTISSAAIDAAIERDAELYEDCNI